MTKRNFKIIDLETSIKNRGKSAIGSNKASPFCIENQVCWTGITDSVGYVHTTRESSISIAEETKLLVGANIKFDLLYLMRNQDFREWMRKGRIWDVQLAEYLLTGQEHLWAKLDDLAIKYGGTVKDDRLKELWNNDVDTENIDPDIIVPYLRSDVINTEIVFKNQLSLAQELGMMPLMWAQMDALLATTEMEFNGMKFNKDACIADSVIIAEAVYKLGRDLEDILESSHVNPEGESANPNSAKQVSAFLFGGTVVDKVPEPVLSETGEPVVYKSGKRKGEVRTVLRSRERRVRGIGAIPNADWETSKKGVYQVNDKVLKTLLKNGYSYKNFILKLLRLRSMSKDLKTYFKGYSDLTWPDGFIHPNFNHCATATGRLSHSAPNLGNVSHNKDN